MEFRILGPLEVLEDGRPVELAGGRQRTLLALLLLHANEVVSNDRLIDGLWGERPPATAAKVLQNAVSHLRRSLGDHLIVTRAPGYLLQVGPEAIDARRFESLLDDGRQTLAAGRPAEAAETLRDGLALWRGPPLDEFAYEPFAAAEIPRLAELRLRALEERIEADLALGRHADLVGELERLVSEHPLRERPRGQLMLALYQSGRQAEALQAYQDGRRLLAEELGLEPGAGLQRLEKQILTQDPALESPALVPLQKDEPRGSATRTKRPSRRLALGLAAIALTAAALLAALLFARGGDPAPTVVPNSVVKIDPETGEIVDVFRVGGLPFKPAIVGDYVFVSSEEDDILSRIDVRSGEVDAHGGLQSPAGVAAGADGTLWVGTSYGDHVSQINADDYQLRRRADVPLGSQSWFVAVGGGSVWVDHIYPTALSRFSARTGKLQRRYVLPDSAGISWTNEVAFGEGAAWTAVVASSQGQGVLLRTDALGGGSERIPVGNLPYAVAVGFGAVWLTDLVEEPLVNAEPEAGQLFRIDPATGDVDDVTPVGKWPAGVTTGGGSVWVANGGERTISEIDPGTNQVVKTIPTRYYPYNLTYGHGFLWVAVQAEPFDFFRETSEPAADS